MPAVNLGKAKMPRHLSPLAKKYWREHGPGLEQRGCLTALDAMAFASLCEAWATIRLCDEIMQRDGLTITGPRGKVSPHPLVRERARWERLFLLMSKDFGMTPSSRRRLRVPDPEPEEDEFFKLLDGGKNTPEAGE
jgi:P27 family predicted phage terminase small subunit